MNTQVTPNSFLTNIISTFKFLKGLCRLVARTFFVF
jgi:hypothetical protein